MVVRVKVSSNGLLCHSHNNNQHKKAFEQGLQLRPYHKRISEAETDNQYTMEVAAEAVDAAVPVEEVTETEEERVETVNDDRGDSDEEEEEDECRVCRGPAEEG